MMSVLSARARARAKFGAQCSRSAKSKCLVLVFSRRSSTEHQPSTNLAACHNFSGIDTFIQNFLYFKAVILYVSNAQYI